MRLLISKLLLVGAILLLTGCERDAEVENLSKPRHVADFGSVDIYVVPIDGHDYIVVIDSPGVAICPKTP